MTAADRAIALFIDDLDRAADDLALAVNNVFPERYVEVTDDDEEALEAGKRLVIGPDDIDDCPSGDIDEALEEFNREIRRRLRELKEALAKEAADGR
jgi:hypothetical protein